MGGMDMRFLRRGFGEGNFVNGRALRIVGCRVYEFGVYRLL